MFDNNFADGTNGKNSNSGWKNTEIYISKLNKKSFRAKVLKGYKWEVLSNGETMNDRIANDMPNNAELYEFHQTRVSFSLNSLYVILYSAYLI